MLLGDNAKSATCILAGLAAAIVILSKVSASRKLDAFPTIGSTSWPGPWAKYGTELIQEGYAKYKSAPFKIADGFGWVIVLGNRRHVEEAESAPQNVAATVDKLRLEYTMGAEVFHNGRYLELTLARLNRNLNSIYNDVRDEVVASFDAVLDLRDDEWKSIPAITSIQQIVSRSTNRLFVGLPLCRNPDWIDLNVRYTLDISHGASKLWMVPDFLAPFIIKYKTEIPTSIECGMKLLAPIIQERQRLLKEHGEDWVGKPNDVLSWLLDIEPDATIRLTTLRLLTINFAAIHTTSISFSHALFYLVQYPEYIQQLRDDVESIVMKEGWSNVSVGKMLKVDSFLKECQRLAGVSTTTMLRKVVKDLTFSDGTTIPKGTHIVGPAREFHRDDEVYHDALEFNPFRFSDIQEENGKAAKHQFTWAHSSDYWPFGHGKHTCPGRFFVASELKTMLAHVVMSYDVKLADRKPMELLIGDSVIPDPTVKIMFRKREI